MGFREKRRIEVLKLQVDEWRIKYHAIDMSYDKIRSRSMTLLGIQLGVIGFFIAQLDDIIKPELYGIIFFVIASMLSVISFILAVWNYIAKKMWVSPMYDVEIDKMNRSANISDAYQVLADDYKASYDSNIKIHEPAARRLNWSLFTFIGSVIILMVLKFA